MGRREIWHLMVCLAFVLVMVASCGAPAARPTPPPTPTPSVAPSPTPTPAPTPEPLPSGATVQSILGIHTTKAVGEQKVIVIIADFPDVKPTLSREQIYNKVFVDLDNYFRDASY